MSKRLICLFLCLVMLAGVLLTSCGDKSIEDTKDETKEEASQSAVTLRLCLMTELPVVDNPKDDEDTYDIVVKAINAVTKKKFKTQLEIEFWTYDEYYRNLDRLFAKRDEAKKNGTISADKEAADVYDADGFIVYPSIAEYQVDIFYLGGEEIYEKYRNEKRLKRIDDQVNAAADINTNIPKQFLNNMKGLDRDKYALDMAPGTYAISMSRPIGSYTYLMLNRDVLEALYGDRINVTEYTKNYTSITCESVQYFVDFVNDEDNGLLNDYYPIYTNLSEKELMINNLKYWGIDENGELEYWNEDEDGELSKVFSVLGGYYDDGKEYLDANAYAKVENLFENEKFINDITVLKQYDVNGDCHYDEVKGKKFAIGYMRGGADLEQIYGDDYVLIPVELPRLERTDLYEHMFGISENTANVGRSIEILSLLNTDESFRNLLVYGVEGIHYHLRDTNVQNKYGENIMAIERTAKGLQEYSLDVNKTGNTFLTYPIIKDDYTDEEIENLAYHNSLGIKQNQQAKVALDLGYSIDYKSDTYKVDKNGLKEIRRLSEDILEEYIACEDMTEFEVFLADAKKTVANNAAVKRHIGTGNNALAASYQAWLVSKGVVKA